MNINGNRRAESPALPGDFEDCPLEYLEVMNVSGADKWLPQLPKTLIELHLPGCRLKSLPQAWIAHQKLQTLDLNNVRLGRFPLEALEMQSLKVLNLSLNDITNVPTIRLPPGRKLKINLWGNPIQHLAPETEALEKRGIIHIEQ